MNKGNINMKASKIFALSGLVMMMAAGSAMAASPMTVTGSSVNFTGEVTDGACGISAGSKDQTVKLATAPVSGIVKGSIYKPTEFDITLEGCSVDTYTTASFNFTGNTVEGGILSNMAPQNSASGVGIQLVDMDSKPINVGDTGKGAKLNLAAGTANVARFTAGLYGLTTASVVKSGTVSATASFNIVYE